MSHQPADLEEVLKGLPHAEPFRFLDRVVKLEEDLAEGVWSVRGDEDFLRGHFPGRPLVPGVLLSEAAAQLAGLITHQRTGVNAAVLVISEARFKRSVKPPADIQLKVNGDRVMGAIHLFDFSVKLDGALCADGQVGLRVDDSA